MGSNIYCLRSYTVSTLSVTGASESSSERRAPLRMLPARSLTYEE